ncbi:hypothetical protein GPECTOR_1018g287 [Gonium pectorale]|uniref:Core-binding (CB) domain-containing protein n=1 Tax=Gonium pectorale TaxID=33097 RepID=A0A150FVE8_GONPE|nr:hypothetical protein GPECTOR_1018g287 [Gonium pectorale]|eukprot:KXZ41000.1 hypothetical protein GPECTOR_1018g287 [Gonium pectorale]
MNLPQRRLLAVEARMPVSSGSLTALESAALYEQHLGDASQFLRGALAPSTVQRQDGAAADLGAWLRQSGCGRSLADCTPEDVLVYFSAWWLPRHGNRSSGAGDAPGPSAVRSHLSALSGFFSRAGRGARYDYGAGQGNPCDSVTVGDYRSAYQRAQVKAGYQEVSAVPMTPAKYRALVAHLWARVGAEPGPLPRLVLLRDLACILLLWQTTVRGHDIGKLGLGDFVDPDRPDQPFRGFPLPLPGEVADRAPTLCFRLRGSKTYQLSRAPPVWLFPNPSEPAFCAVGTLALYLRLSSQSAALPGVAVSDAFFRPLTADRRGFAAGPLRSAALSARVRLHLQESQLYDGETVHSFRRGALQAASADGAGTPALLGFGQLRSVATLERYLDRGRHERVTRARL